ncbi:hypothetical protein CCH79_00019305 [Gambusia affinis]|uniref:Uncharacterized protein n=1 Tax=Gambusia affinis TaxID=33528 RepID=A0A315WAQ4_GAMAF|nr:hypothetical protein CCH79_00019305 [Gambusia affinis]
METSSLPVQLAPPSGSVGHRGARCAVTDCGQQRLGSIFICRRPLLARLTCSSVSAASCILDLHVYKLFQRSALSVQSCHVVFLDGVIGYVIVLEQLTRRRGNGRCCDVTFILPAVTRVPQLSCLSSSSPSALLFLRQAESAAERRTAAAASCGSRDQQDELLTPPTQPSGPVQSLRICSSSSSSSSLSVWTERSFPGLSLRLHGDQRSTRRFYPSRRQEEANQEGEERPEIVFGVRLAAETKVTPVLLLL